jgi:hypothetical protein
MTFLNCGKIFASLFLSACMVSCTPPPKVVTKEQQSEPTVTSVKRSCNKQGWCWKCMEIDLDMDTSCGYRFSNYCRGERDVTLKQTSFRITYDDGTSRDVKESEVIASGRCQ